MTKFPPKLQANRAPVADERAAFARHVSGRDDLELYQIENVIDANLTRWTTWRAARDYYQQARAALASAPVAGEAQPSDADITKTIRVLRDEARHTRCADGEMGVRVQDVMIARAVLARYGHTPLPMADAAPQASAEDVRNAALEEAAKLMDQTLRSKGAALIRGLKRSQADKDGGQQRAAEASAPDTAKDRVDKILRERMAPISEALGLDVMLASVFKDGFQIITFEFETLVYSIGSDGAAILRVSFNCSHAPDTLTADQVQIISQAAAEVRPVGGEVLAWLDQHRGVTSRPATAMSSLELYRQWRAAEQAQAAAPCTCPSGDGSLRHPCAAHPAKASGNGGEEWSDS